MLVAMVHLREAYTEMAITEEDDELLDFEETGFQAAYSKLAVAAPANVEPVECKSVDEAVKYFVRKFVSARAGELVNKVKSGEGISEEVVRRLVLWGVPL
jgi:hypothetical protein